ncbi:hypothetical protein KDA_47040 [Dictyobacter alpinus]|uniref:Uncharacterized protein n=1 Tax=Dictyobacter alpinus TaxID=2014873 RepID=A0A402BD25_9CHLR|nr:hypothetical protein KDA_47040 [Dictyobacter alpinus]
MKIGNVISLIISKMEYTVLTIVGYLNIYTQIHLIGRTSTRIWRWMSMGTLQITARISTNGLTMVRIINGGPWHPTIRMVMDTSQ